MSDGPAVIARGTLRTPEDTAALGHQLGARLQPGDCIALVGEMGAGKTTLVRALAEGLRVEDPDAVSSPTWLVVLEHPGPVPLLHGDAWQPDKLRAFVADGGGQYLQDEGAVLVLEWADQVPELLPDRRLWVRLSHGAGPDSRGVEFAPEPIGAFAWVAELPILRG